MNDASFTESDEIQRLRSSWRYSSQDPILSRKYLLSALWYISPEPFLLGLVKPPLEGIHQISDFYPLLLSSVQRSLTLNIRAPSTTSSSTVPSSIPSLSRILLGITIAPHLPTRTFMVFRY
jgi:hypothetical protein